MEDLQVGQRFVSRSHTLDKEQIKAFAAQFDPQVFHLDEETAGTTFFGDLVASGWHTAAVTMRLLVDSGAPIAGGVIGARGEISWPRPTRPGDVLTVESEVLEIVPSRSKLDRGMVTLRSETRNQCGEILQILKATLVVPRRPKRPAGRRRLRLPRTSTSCGYSPLKRVRLREAPALHLRLSRPALGSSQI